MTASTVTAKGDVSIGYYLDIFENCILPVKYFVCMPLLCVCGKYVLDMRQVNTHTTSCGKHCSISFFFFSGEKIITINQFVWVFCFVFWGFCFVLVFFWGSHTLHIVPKVHCGLFISLSRHY